MKDIHKALSKKLAVLLLASFVIASCTSAPAPNDPYNDADSQRSRADKAQDELSRDTK